MAVGVIVVAGGRGTRLGGDVPKQYLPVAGVPLLLRTLAPFLAHADVRHLALVLPAEDVAAPPPWLAPVLEGGRGRVHLAPGGRERADSVAAGLAALPDECDVVLVHDAARPFVAAATIDGVIAGARRGEGAVAAVPVSDTIKEATAPGATLVARTVPRERLWRAQTPQGFPRAVLARAHASARAAGMPATDDAALVERLGVPVRLVPDSARNFKVTTAEDLELAELWARHVS
ncbi:MAG TPA: 2-C-methyl-D-erythritol 4-phosphate cytidylyltransferase [Gemmatimonadales bacterium]|nr:2-C-methyl-D-erythritol 4-phosphate cytidylyltransferase [Gemmatimonadales bacterium]